MSFQRHGLSDFVDHGAGGPEIDLAALMEGKVRLVGAPTAPEAPAPSRPAPLSEASPAVKALLEATGIGSVLSEGVEWPTTLTKQVNLLGDMLAEFQGALDHFKEGAKSKASDAEMEDRRATVSFLASRLSSNLHMVADSTWALAPMRRQGCY